MLSQPYIHSYDKIYTTLKWTWMSFCREDKTVVICETKHLQKCFRAVDFPRLCRGRKNVVKMFYFTRNHGLTVKDIFITGWAATIAHDPLYLPFFLLVLFFMSELLLSCRFWIYIIIAIHFVQLSVHKLIGWTKIKLLTNLLEYNL